MDEALASLARGNADLEILYETVSDLTSTLSTHQVLTRLLERTLTHLDAEIGSILLVETDGRLRIFTARGLPSDIVESTEVRVGEGISGHVAATRQAVFVQDVERDPQFQRRNHERYYTHSLVSAPLLRGNQVLGVVNANNKKNQRPFSLDDLRLLQAIAGHAAVALGNARQYEETLRRAQHDALTGLANHGHLFASLDGEIERAKRYTRDLSLAMIDIDHFKAYNDRFGHRAGDDALVAVADVVTTLSRTSDLAARYGGEEFAIVLPETSLEGAFTFGEKVREAVESTSFGPGNGEALTVSVGVAPLPRRAVNASTLVEAADAQLYRAKALGRNCVCAPERNRGGLDD